MTFWNSFSISSNYMFTYSVVDYLDKKSSKFHNSIWIEEVPSKLKSLVYANVLAFMAT